MENNYSTHELLRQEAKHLLENPNIYNSTKQLAIEFLNDNMLDTLYWGKVINLQMFGLEKYTKNLYVFIQGFFSIIPDVIISQFGFKLSDNMISILSDIGFYKFWDSDSYCKAFDEGYYKFPKYKEFYNHIKNLLNMKSYEICIICFYMMIIEIADVVSDNSIFKKNSIPDDLIEKSTLKEVLSYYIHINKLTDMNNSETILLYELNISLFTCYIFQHEFFGYTNLVKLISDCIEISDKIVEKNKNDIFWGKRNNITEYNSFAVAVENYITKSKAVKEEKKENKKKEYIYLIVTHSKNILSDSTIESAISKLIGSIPIDRILSIKGYNGWRGAFLQDTILCRILYTDVNWGKAKPQILSDLKVILTKRYNLPDEYAIEITWCIYNYCIIRKYSKKWMDICVTGEIGNRTLEKYLSDCFNDDMISLDDEERIAMFCYYISSTKETDDLFFDLFILQPDYSEYKHIKELLAKFKDENRTASLESRLFGNVGGTSSEKAYYTIDDIDLMTGIEFENFIKKLFIAMGYSADTTKASGDQGIDVIVEKNGIKYGIQAKCYSGTVGNSAVQEAVAGRLYYGLDKVIVITNSRFTKAAIKLAASNGAVLWDRSILAEKLIYIN